MPSAITITITITMMTEPAVQTGDAQAELLRLLAWLSPAFPTGAYAYSHGLEQAIEDGDIADGETLRNWLTDVLHHGSGRNDVILLRHAHRAGTRPDRVESTSPSPWRHRANGASRRWIRARLSSLPRRRGRHRACLIASPIRSPSAQSPAIMASTRTRQPPPIYRRSPQT